MEEHETGKVESASRRRFVAGAAAASGVTLLGRAPAPLQRRDARVAATFNIGGPLCASVCTVLRRD